MRRDVKIIFVFIILYLINRLAKNYINIPVISYLSKCYLSDFYCGIIFCAYFNIIISKSKYKPFIKYYQFFLLTLTAGIVWEYITPMFIKSSVSDKYDIVAYILGATVFYIIKTIRKE